MFVQIISITRSYFIFTFLRNIYCCFILYSYVKNIIQKNRTRCKFYFYFEVVFNLEEIMNVLFWDEINLTFKLFVKKFFLAVISIKVTKNLIFMFIKKKK